jgi:hypothetical protein
MTAKERNLSLRRMQIKRSDPASENFQADVYGLAAQRRITIRVQS